MSDEKQYAQRSAMELDRAGGHFSRHLSAMTGEGLHSKSDIACELAYRDMRIAELEAALAEAKRDAEHLRSESVTLAGILRDCDSVLATIEPESTAEADSMADLRRAIAYALGPYGDTGNLPGIEPRRRIVFACPVCAASLERTS